MVPSAVPSPEAPSVDMTPAKIPTPRRLDMSAGSGLSPSAKRPANRDSIQVVHTGERPLTLDELTAGFYSLLRRVEKEEAFTDVLKDTVIQNADHLNLVGLSKAVNDLAFRSRNQSLKPEEVQGGTFTITNVGNFGSLMGTPIINQPQVGIVAVGVIRKVPSVIETPKGDFIGIRRKVMLSHTYDHRIINGAMGGNFVKKMADYLDQWDENLII